MGSTKTIRILSRTAFVLLLLTAFVFGIKQLREPDIFWQLRTGEWIVQHRSVMNKDIFSFTFHGAPWINVKWGFEVLLYFVYRIGGVAFTPVLQCFASLLILLVFWHLYKLLHTNLTGNKPSYPHAAFLITGILFILGLAYRMNGRPEMTSHLFTGLFLFILLACRYRPSNWMFILIPLEILWVNMHEAYGIGEVMMVVMMFSSWIDYFFIRKQKFSVPLKLSITVVLAILATAIHPFGIKMILHPYEIFSQVKENKFTTELLSFTNHQYWQKEAWINILFLITSITGLFIHFKIKEQENSEINKVKWFITPFYNFGAGYILLLVLFFYLSLTAYRNIAFFIIISAPVAAITLKMCFLYLSKKIKLFSSTYIRTALFAFVFVMCLAFFVSVPTNFYYDRAENQNNHYGLRIDPLMNPVGAAQFLKTNHISGLSFNDFLISNYLLWELRPDFRTFIDLRDLDVFPVSFFKDFALISNFPKKLDQVDSLYHLNYAVIYRNNFLSIHNYLYHNKNWALVYADPVAVVYLKRNPLNNAIISKLTRQGQINDLFYNPSEINPSEISKIFPLIFCPLADVNYNKNTDYNLIAASYYLSMGDARLALKRAEISLKNNTEGCNNMMGDINLYKYNHDTSQIQKTADINAAQNYYEKTIEKNKKNARALNGLAGIEMIRDNYTGAWLYLKKSISYDQSVKESYILLANCMNRFEQEDNGARHEEYVQIHIDALEKALLLDPEDNYIKFYLGIIYGNKGECDKAVRYLKPLMNYPGFSVKEIEEAKKIMIRCSP